MAITTASFAQKKFAVMINTGYNYAIGPNFDDVTDNRPGNIGTFSSSLISHSFRLTYGISEKIVVTAGYAFNFPTSSYRSRATDGVTSSVDTRLHQISVGANYYFATTRLRPFVGLDLGVGLVGYDSKNLSTANSVTYNQTGFLFSPKVGVDYDLNDHWYLNADLHYIGVTGGKLTAKRNETRITTAEKAGFNNLIGLNVGIGYRF